MERSSTEIGQNIKEDKSFVAAIIFFCILLKVNSLVILEIAKITQAWAVQAIMISTGIIVSTLVLWLVSRLRQLKKIDFITALKPVIIVQIISFTYGKLTAPLYTKMLPSATGSFNVPGLLMSFILPFFWFLILLILWVLLITSFYDTTGWEAVRVFLLYIAIEIILLFVAFGIAALVITPAALMNRAMLLGGKM